MANQDLRAEPLSDKDRALIAKVFSNPLVLPTIFKEWLVAYVGPEIQVTASQVVSTSTAAVIIGAGNPEGTQAAPVGAIYLRTDGSAGTTLYVKETGVGTTGWVARDHFTNGITLSDGTDVAIGGGTGSKIGSAASKLGFFGVAPSTRPAATDEIKAALALLGLLTDAGASPLDLDGGKLTAGEINPTGDLNHDGAKVGLYGAAPATQPALTTDLLDALQTLGLIASGAGDTPLDLTGGALKSGAHTLKDGTDLIVGAVTGSKLGQALSKLGFFGAAPVVQQTVVTDLLDALQALGLIASGAGDTPLDLTGGALKSGAHTLKDGTDLIVGAVTGSKIGQSTSKLGFFGAAPVVQPAAGTELKAALASLGLLIDGSASNLDLDGGVMTGGVDANAKTIRLPFGSGALTATEGHIGWDSSKQHLRVYDSQRERIIGPVGWQPYAYPLGGGPTDVVTTALALAANGGCIAIPVVLDAHMLLDGVTVRNTDAATARSWNWHLYEEYLDNGNSGENTLARIATGAGGSFTPAAASNQTVAASGGPIYLPPGCYWLVIQSTHATSTFGLGTQAAGTLATNTAQTKTVTNPAGATLDFVLATWTKVAALAGVRLNGRVFGQTSAF